MHRTLPFPFFGAMPTSNDTWVASKSIAPLQRLPETLVDDPLVATSIFSLTIDIILICTKTILSGLNLCHKQTSPLRTKIKQM